MFLRNYVEFHTGTRLFTKIYGRCRIPFFLQELSESSRCDLSRTIIYQSIEHGNDLTCHTEPVVLFLVLRKNNFSPQQGQRRAKF